MKSGAELKVFIARRDSFCEECQEQLGRGAWITPVKDRGALCLACADLEHLEFLPSGDAALTRRSKKYSTLSAVVLQWSRTRKRYERQGLLVEAERLNRLNVNVSLMLTVVRDGANAKPSVVRLRIDSISGNLPRVFENCSRTALPRENSRLLNMPA